MVVAIIFTWFDENIFESSLWTEQQIFRFMKMLRIACYKNYLLNYCPFFGRQSPTATNQHENFTNCNDYTRMHIHSLIWKIDFIFYFSFQFHHSYLSGIFFLSFLYFINSSGSNKSNSLYCFDRIHIYSCIYACISFDWL